MFARGGDEQLADEAAVRPGLFGDEHLAEHCFGDRQRLRRRVWQSFTPPWKPLLNVPLPRPPAWICDLTTTTLALPPAKIFSAAARACFGGCARTSPCGTATPYCASKLFGLIFVNVHVRNKKLAGLNAAFVQEINF